MLLKYPFQDWKVIGTGRWISSCAHLRGLYWEDATTQRRAELKYMPLVTSKTSNASNNCSSNRQKRQRSDSYGGRGKAKIPNKLATWTHAGSLGRLKMSPNRSRHRIQGFAYPLVDASNTMKVLEQSWEAESYFLRAGNTTSYHTHHIVLRAMTEEN